MKDEAAGAPIVEFVGLRPKMYSYLIADDVLDSDGKPKLKEKHRAKGISAAASKTLRHENFLEQLQTPTENYQRNRRIGSKLHQLYSFETQKRGLCAFDDKRFLLEDGIHTKAFGHKDIPAHLEDFQPDPDVAAPGLAAVDVPALVEEELDQDDFPVGVDPVAAVEEARELRARVDALRLRGQQPDGHPGLQSQILRVPMAAPDIQPHPASQSFCTGMHHYIFN